MSRPLGVCAYYNAPGGCSRGARCTYKHLGVEGVGVPERPILTAASTSLDGTAKRSKPNANAHAASNAQLLKAAVAPITPQVIHVHHPNETRTDSWANLTAASFSAANSSNSTNDKDDWITVGSSHSSTSSHLPQQSQQSPQPQRGLLKLPESSQPAKKPHPPPQPKSNKPRPKATWSITDRLDLSSLSKLDAITKKRPLLDWTAEDSSASQSAFPPLLPITSAWAKTSSTAAASSAAAAASHAITAASSSSSSSNVKKTLRPGPSSHLAVNSASNRPGSALVASKSASHKPNKVSFDLASTRATARPKSASVKAHKKKPSQHPAVIKKPKPTKLKKALIQERVKKWCLEIVQAMVERASHGHDGDGTSSSLALPFSMSPFNSAPQHLTNRQREQALAALTKKIKQAAHETYLAKREEELAKQRAAKEAVKAENQRRRAEEHARQHAEKVRRKMEKLGLTTAMPTIPATAAVIASLFDSSNHPSQPSAASSSSVLVQHPSLDTNSTSSDPVATSTLLSPSLQSALLQPLPSPSPSPAVVYDLDELKSNGPPPVDEHREDGESEHDDDRDRESASEDEAQDDRPSDIHAHHDPPSIADESNPDVSEFLPAPSLPSTHLVAHFPSASPPTVTDPSVATSSTSSTATAVPSLAFASPAGVRTIRSLTVPSTLQLTPQEQALLNWHFQARHHGIQPVLQGACQRHCKQMWKKSIDDRVFMILRELNRFDVRLKERDPVKAAQRKRYVSGLKQTWKLISVNRIKCVIVAANIEANEAAGGLDDLLDDILGQCAEQRIPIIFALTRQSLGKAVKSTNACSAVGILDYSGVGDEYKQLLQETLGAQEEWSMFQEDDWLNPKPPGYHEQLVKDSAILLQKKLARAQKKKEKDERVAKADEQRRQYELAQRQAKGGGDGGGRKKSKTKLFHQAGGGRDLLPLPVLSEEDMKGGRRRKGRRKGQSAAAETEVTSSSTASTTSATAAGASSKKAGNGSLLTKPGAALPLKGAGSALSSITQQLVDDSSSNEKKSHEVTLKSKSQKKEEGQSKKKEAKGKSKK